ncbi:hypothetical protein GCM10009769_19620 [Curtobacterium luteum]|uniref:DUF1905 domain-containing protein n=2 Tax=Curtobacterium luteum TaxID=33881 RepID=A0A8H9GA61_9MICO|nr:hypothetical protein GCM10009769_19620 [Curtobacterium luteum]
MDALLVAEQPARVTIAAAARAMPARVRLCCTGCAFRVGVRSARLCDSVGHEDDRGRFPVRSGAVNGGRTLAAWSLRCLARAMRFTTTVLQARTTATGLPVPPEVIEALGAGKRPAVVVTLDGGYTYRSTVGVMGAQSLVPLSAAHREAARVQAGDTVEVTLEVDTTPRTVAVPDDLAAALDAAGVRAAFETLSNSRQRAVVDPVLAAKAPETRARRVAKAVESLRA